MRVEFGISGGMDIDREKDCNIYHYQQVENERFGAALIYLSQHI